MIMINTKRIFTALLLAIIAVTGYAYDFEVDGIYYSYDVYGNAVVTHGDKKYTGKIKIPSEVKWNGKKKKVVEIGDYAFECCYELKSVSIPSSVYYIGRFAFDNCRLLEEINIPNGVEAIKVSAFANCICILHQLKSVNHLLNNTVPLAHTFEVGTIAMFL